MNRSEFLGTFGAALAATTLPASATGALITKDLKDVRLIVDYQTINGFSRQPPRMTVADIFKLYQKTGVFLYDGSRGDAPQLISGEAKIVTFDND